MSKFGHQFRIPLSLTAGHCIDCTKKATDNQSHRVQNWIFSPAPAPRAQYLSRPTGSHDLTAHHRATAPPRDTLHGRALRAYTNWARESIIGTVQVKYGIRARFSCTDTPILCKYRVRIREILSHRYPDTL